MMKYTKTIILLLWITGPVSLKALAGNICVKDSVWPVVVTRDIQYGEAVHYQKPLALLLDVYQSSVKSSLKRPVIIFVHGGGFSYGDKEQDLYVKMATAFAKRGYVSFSVNYRLKDPKKPYVSKVLDDAMADVMMALRWVKDHRKEYNIDTAKIIICGDSAGGAIAVNTSYDHALEHVFIACIDLWGGMCDPKDPEFLHVPPWDQPIYPSDIQPGTPPTCIIHGTSDTVVPYSTSEALSHKLAKAKIYHELHPLKGANHYPEKRADEFIPLMLSFANSVLSVDL